MLKIFTEELAKQISEQVAQLPEVKSKEGATFKVIATNETRDRDGEIIKVTGWNFDNYMKNPVILSNHNYKIENIVGRATRIYVENGNVIIEGVFAETPAGVLAQSLYDGGFLKTVSVGFIPKERDKADYRTITQAELLEVSFVPVPSNPTALSLDAKSFGEAKKTGLVVDESEVSNAQVVEAIKEFSELVKGFQTDLLEVKEILTAKKEREQIDFDIKENMQTAERALSEALRGFKLKKMASA